MVGPVPMSLDVPAALACSTNNTIGALLQSCIPTNLPWPRLSVPLHTMLHCTHHKFRNTIWLQWSTLKNVMRTFRFISIAKYKHIRLINKLPMSIRLDQLNNLLWHFEIQSGTSKVLQLVFLAAFNSCKGCKGSKKPGCNRSQICHTP